MNFKTPLFCFVLIGVLLPILSVYAAAPVEFKTLVGIPGIDNPELSFGAYINALYTLAISIAALLSVIKIIIAGMKYMLSDVVNTKGDAIKDIQGALFGLLVVISAVLILNVINPQLTQTEIFLDKVDSNSQTTGNPTPTTNYSGPDVPRQKNISCADINNCTEAKKSCTDAGGIEVGKSTFNVTCRYGKETNFPCQVSTDSEGMNVYQCSDSVEMCKKLGTPYEDGAKVVCVIPFR